MPAPPPVITTVADANKASDDGKWLTLSVGLPDYLKDAKDKFHSGASTLITLMDIALAALRLAKALSLSYLDPLIAILEAIVNELQGYINDLTKGGIFISGDWKYFVAPFEDLRGGFSAYERRMVSRFADPTDPTRPNLSPSSAAMAVFVYSEEDLTAVMNIVRLVKLLMKFFGQDFLPKGLPAVSNLKVAYGLADMNAFDYFRSLGDYFDSSNAGKVPNVARVTWNANITPNSMGLTLPNITVGGYLIQVSTVKDGLPIYYERNVDNVPKTILPSGGTATQKVVGRVLDPSGQPLTLYGGADQIFVEGALGFNSNIDANGVLRPGAARVFAKKSQADDVAIPLDLLKDGDDYLYQKTFFLDATTAAFYPGDGFGFPLAYDQMPFDATAKQESDGTVILVKGERPLNYYVRVTPTSTGVTSAAGEKGVTGEGSFYFWLSSDTISAPQPFRATAAGVNSKGERLEMGADYGQTSDALPILFPSINTKTYMDRVAIALAVLVLSRSDLSVYEGTDPASEFNTKGMARTPTGLEPFGSLVNWIYSGPNNVFESPDTSPDSFRSDLWSRCRQLAYDLYQKTGPMPAIEEFVVAQTGLLDTWTWGQDSGNFLLAGTKATIVESLNANAKAGEYEGLALNPWCLAPLSVVQGTYLAPTGSPINSREPGFFAFLPERVFTKDGYTQEELHSTLAPYPPLQAQFRMSIEMGSWPINQVDRLYYLPPQFVSGDSGKLEGSEDHSPIYYTNWGALKTGTGGQIFFCRNLFSAEVYKQAAVALNIAASSFGRRKDKGEWIAIRPFQAMPDLFGMLDTIVMWAQGLTAGLKSIADALDSYIEFIEARILEIQQLIRRIDALVQSIEMIQVPSFSGLIVHGNGTDGLLSGFLSAQDKPSSSGADVYGAGVVIVMGGIPAASVPLLELLLAKV